MWTQLQPGQQPESPPADPYWRETVHVRQVWEEFLLPEEPEGPQVFLPLRLCEDQVLYNLPLLEVCGGTDDSEVLVFFVGGKDGLLM